jgi:16S rRNA G966 N2-methylase RsmD
MKLYNDDCLKVLPTIPDKSIDLILTDPPYGTTLVSGIMLFHLNQCGMN